jgi:hypothetical protein
MDSLGTDLDNFESSSLHLVTLCCQGMRGSDVKWRGETPQASLQYSRFQLKNLRYCKLKYLKSLTMHTIAILIFPIIALQRNVLTKISIPCQRAKPSYRSTTSAICHKYILVIIIRKQKVKIGYNDLDFFIIHVTCLVCRHIKS